MKDVLRRTWAPLLVVSLAQLVMLSRSVSISGGAAEAISKAILFFGLFLSTTFIGGAVHVGLLRRRLDASLTVCLLDGATIGLLPNLIVQILFIALQGKHLDLVMPPSGGVDPVLWLWKLVLSSVIMLIFGFIGLLSGGMGGGLGYLVSAWTTRASTLGEKHG
jgi:hypothetical protein